MRRRVQRLGLAHPAETMTLSWACAAVAVVCAVLVVYPFSSTAPRSLTVVLSLATILVTLCVAQSTTPNGTS